MLFADPRVEPFDYPWTRIGGPRTFERNGDKGSDGPYPHGETGRRRP